MLEVSMAEYDLCMNLNVRSAFVITQKCLPHLIKTKGSIVHVSSVTGGCCAQGPSFFPPKRPQVKNLSVSFLRFQVPELSPMSSSTT